MPGFDCGDKAADWLTAALKRKCRLIYYGSGKSNRPTVSSREDHPLVNDDDTVIIDFFCSQDFCPFEKKNNCHLFELYLRYVNLFTFKITSRLSCLPNGGSLSCGMPLVGDLRQRFLVSHRSADGADSLASICI